MTMIFPGMKKLAPAAACVALLFFCVAARMEKPEDVTGQLQKDFERYSGARLVFDTDDLPTGQYHDIMPALSEAARLRAAKIAVREVRKLPKGYLSAVGLKAIGIFEACLSVKNDGFHQYDAQYKGYRYFGIYNGKNAVAAAFYTDGQLPLTMHHEIFHHVDATHKGKLNNANSSDDPQFKQVAAGKILYPAAKISPGDLAALKKLARGYVLETVVSDYCKKNLLEDKAETARYFMSTLPDSLIQIATRPDLAGSQRMLHVLRRYEEALPKDGPALEWFVDVALGRAKSETLGAEIPNDKQAATAPENPFLKKVDEAIADPDVRATIRKVQPACVRLDGASGVNLTAAGHILTAAHVGRRLNTQLMATFPDGKQYQATCIAIDKKLDLAILRVDAKVKLPFAPVAKGPPEIGTPVVCIGQPGSTRPDGTPTDYKPFHVSTGQIRGFLPDPLGDQSLGRTKHDAWTYWGHSGSPIFNERGAIVAMHNSWDSNTTLRHAVTYQAIVHFLKKEKIGFTVGE